MPLEYCYSQRVDPVGPIVVVAYDVCNILAMRRNNLLIANHIFLQLLTL